MNKEDALEMFKDMVTSFMYDCEEEEKEELLAMERYIIEHLQ